MNFVQLTPTSVGIHVDFVRRRGPELARDIVCALDSPANLAKSYGLTEHQWAVLQVWPAFVQMVREASEELAGSAGTPERARRKAALAIAEVGVQDMAVIMGDPKVSPRDRINAFSELKDIAVLGSKQQIAAAASGGGPAIGGGPLIQIVLPSGAQLHVGEAAKEEQLLPVIEGESERVE
mgnify:CR=1 FL=1